MEKVCDEKQMKFQYLCKKTRGAFIREIISLRLFVAKQLVWQLYDSRGEKG